MVVLLLIAKPQALSVPVRAPLTVALPAVGVGLGLLPQPTCAPRKKPMSRAGRVMSLSSSSRANPGVRQLGGVDGGPNEGFPTSPWGRWALSALLSRVATGPEEMQRSQNNRKGGAGCALPLEKKSGQAASAAHAIHSSVEMSRCPLHPSRSRAVGRQVGCAAERLSSETPPATTQSQLESPSFRGAPLCLTAPTPSSRLAAPPLLR